MGFDRTVTYLARFVSSFRRKWKHSTETLALVTSITEYQGSNCAIRLFEEAERSVMVTHFTETREDMSPEYIEAQEAALRSGIQVKRILPESHGFFVQEEYLQWRERYENYTIIPYCGPPLPFDFAIMDGGKKVLLCLLPEYVRGEKQKTAALVISYRPLVRTLLRMFKELEKSSEEIRKQREQSRASAKHQRNG